MSWRAYSSIGRAGLVERRSVKRPDAGSSPVRSMGPLGNRHPCTVHATMGRVDRSRALLGSIAQWQSIRLIT